MLVVPPIEELDLVGPVQVLSTATRLMRRGATPYELRVVTTTRDRLIAGESGLSIVAQAHYGSVERGRHAPGGRPRARQAAAGDAGTW